MKTSAKKVLSIVGNICLWLAAMLAMAWFAYVLVFNGPVIPW